MIRIGTALFLLLSVLENKNVVTAQDTAGCSEHPRQEFLNQRGQSRTCDWLSRNGFESRVEEECSTDPPGSVVVTEADVICPVTCGKCEALLMSNAEEQNEVEETQTTMTEFHEVSAQEDTEEVEEVDEDFVLVDEEIDADLATKENETTVEKAPNDMLDGLADQLTTSSSARPGRPSILPNRFHQRRWTDIQVNVQPDPARVGIDLPVFANVDPAIVATLSKTKTQFIPSMERDPFYFTAEPSSLPSVSPTDVPSLSPSESPSAAPTVPYPVNSQPKSYSSKYFDYQPNGKRGPKNWDNVDDPPEEKYWKEEYGQYIEPSLGKSRCDSKSRRQSPIDVRFDKAQGQCFEYHGVRNKIGEYSIDDPKLETQILPSKLRIVYPNNFGDDDWSGASENDLVKGPSADIPKGWGHQLPGKKRKMDEKRFPILYSFAYIITMFLYTFLFFSHSDSRRHQDPVRTLDGRQAVCCRIPNQSHPEQGLSTRRTCH